MEVKKLSDISEIRLSNIDKKTELNEETVKLCNFTDVYKNFSINNKKAESFMIATANDSEIRNLSLKEGYVAITKDSETRDDIGMSCYVDEDLQNVVLGYHCALIKPNNKIILGKYLNCFLNSKTARKFFSNQASGSGQRYTLGIESIGKIAIPLPSLDIQNKIGTILLNIDKKIQINSQINDELFEMLHQIYNFEILNKHFSKKSSSQVKKSVIKDFASIKTGKEYANYGSDKGRYRFFSCSDDILWGKDFAFEGRSVIVSTHGDFRAFFYNGKFNTYFCDAVLSPFDNSYYGLLYMAINTFLPTLKHKSGGSVIKFISNENILNIPVFLPENEKVLDVMNNCLDLIQHNTDEIIYLKKISEELLPLLINGQVKIN